MPQVIPLHKILLCPLILVVTKICIVLWMIVNVIIETSNLNSYFKTNDQMVKVDNPGLRPKAWTMDSHSLIKRIQFTNLNLCSAIHSNLPQKYSFSVVFNLSVILFQFFSAIIYTKFIQEESISLYSKNLKHKNYCFF